MEVYLHNMIENTRVEGPGLRTAIWFQGCSIRCEGCMIPATWAFSDQNGYKIDELVRRITSNKKIEGLTILGGEPFDQPEALHKLIKEIQVNSNLSIMLFTGYTSEYLTSNCKYFSEIISFIDIFIEGPYIKGLTDFSREWVGSSNQKIHFISEKYLHLKDKIYKDPNDNQIEIRVSKDGSININGMLPKEKLLQIISDLKNKY